MSPISPIVDMLTEIHYILCCEIGITGIMLGILVGSCWRPK
jgi:hypothetical protein